MTQQDIYEQLNRRLEQLEKRTAVFNRGKRRGWTNKRGAAEYVNKSQEWIRQQIQAGRLKHTRQGRFLNIAYDDLDALIVMLGEESETAA